MSVDPSDTDRQPQWLRGVLDLLVLAVLDRSGSRYGYALLGELEDLGVTIKGGTLYPLLARLEQDGLVSTHWTPGQGGPGRKWFRTTARGRTVLAGQTHRWHQFSTTVEQILHTQTTKGDQE